MSIKGLFTFIKYKRRVKSGKCTADDLFELGYCYDQGVGTRIDKYTGFKYYEMAAEKGHGRAQNAVGFGYEYGEGVTKDLQQAVKWYKMSATNGCTKGKFSLGALYLLGEGVRRDTIEAFSLILDAAYQDNKEALQLLDILAKRFHFNTQRVNGRYLPSDPVKAFTYLLQEAKKGNWEAKDVLDSIK